MTAFIYHDEEFNDSCVEIMCGCGPNYYKGFVNAEYDRHKLIKAGDRWACRCGSMGRYRKSKAARKAYEGHLRTVHVTAAAVVVAMR
jgi:hypothetical protein